MADLELEQDLRALFAQADDAESEGERFAALVRARIDGERRLRLGLFVAAILMAGALVGAFLAGLGDWLTAQAEAMGLSLDSSAGGQAWIWPASLTLILAVWLFTSPMSGEA